MDKSILRGRFREFCESISGKDKVIIVHHSDADGFCSALITAKAIERLSGKRPVAVMPYEYGNRAQARKAKAAMKKSKANKLVILDIGIDNAPHGIEELGPFEKCLVIDHHRMYNDLNSEKTVFLKAEFFTEKDPSSYVTSKFAFDLFSKVTDVSEFDWLACLGILGDMNLHTWQGFVQETIGRRNISLTWLYRFLDLIAAVEVMAENRMPELFWEFYNAKNPAGLLENDFRKHLEKFKAEKDSLVEGFKEKAEHFPKIELFFYAIRTRHENIKSYVINEISEMHPDKTIILIQFISGGMARFSARRQDFKVKVNDLLTEATKGIPGSSAGGHTPAAAGSVPRKHLRRFKENVIRILREKYGK